MNSIGTAYWTNKFLGQRFVYIRRIFANVYNDWMAFDGRFLEKVCIRRIQYTYIVVSGFICLTACCLCLIFMAIKSPLSFAPTLFHIRWYSNVSRIDAMSTRPLISYRLWDHRFDWKSRSVGFCTLLVIGGGAGLINGCNFPKFTWGLIWILKAGVKFPWSLKNRYIFWNICNVG